MVSTGAGLQVLKFFFLHKIFLFPKTFLNVSKSLLLFFNNLNFSLFLKFLYFILSIPISQRTIRDMTASIIPKMVPDKLPKNVIQLFLIVLLVIRAVLLRDIWSFMFR